MKKLHLVLVCVAAVLTGLYFISCGSDGNSDENDGGGSSSIVGTWKLSSTGNESYSSSDDDEEYVMLCSDGTGYEFEECRTHGVDVDKFEYIYNESSSKLIVIYDDSGDNSTMNVLAVTDTKLILSNNDSYSGNSTAIFTKVSSPYSASQLEKLYKSQNSSSSY